MARESLPTTYEMKGTIRIKPLASPVIQCPATMVDIKMGQHQFNVKVAVLDRDQLGHDLLLGENIPEHTLQELLTETVPPSEADT